MTVKKPPHITRGFWHDLYRRKRLNGFHPVRRGLNTPRPLTKRSENLFPFVFSSGRFLCAPPCSLPVIRAYFSLAGSPTSFDLKAVFRLVPTFTNQSAFF